MSPKGGNFSFKKAAKEGPLSSSLLREEPPQEFFAQQKRQKEAGSAEGKKKTLSGQITSFERKGKGFLLFHRGKRERFLSILGDFFNHPWDRVRIKQ